MSLPRVGPTPLSAIRQARYQLYESEEREPGDPSGEHSVIVQSTLSGGLEMLGIPFLLFDRAEGEIPEALAEQLRGRKFEPMMGVEWQGQPHLVATICCIDGDDSVKIPIDAKFSALAIVAADLVDLNL